MDALRHQTFSNIDKSAGPACEFKPCHPVEVGLISIWKPKIAEDRAIEHDTGTTDWIAERQQADLIAHLAGTFPHAEGAPAQRALDLQVNVAWARGERRMLRVIAEGKQCRWMAPQCARQLSDIVRRENIVLMSQRYEGGLGLRQREVPVGRDVDPLRIDVQRQSEAFCRCSQLCGGRRTRKQNLAARPGLCAQ